MLQIQKIIVATKAETFKIQKQNDQDIENS